MRPNYPCYPPANGCCPWGRGFLCDRFSQGEIQCLGEISMDTSIRSKELPMTVPEVSSNGGSTNHERLKRTNSRNHVLFTCWVRLGAKLDSETSAGFWALLWIFFCILHFYINLKAPQNTRKFSLHVFKNYFLVKSLKTLLWTRTFDFWAIIFLSLKKMKSTSSFSVSKFKAESLVERVLLIRLWEIQCLQKDSPQNWPVHVFSSLWAM